MCPVYRSVLILTRYKDTHDEIVQTPMLVPTTINTLNAGGVYIRTRIPYPSPREAYIYALLHVPAFARPLTYQSVLPRRAAVALTQQGRGTPLLEP